MPRRTLQGCWGGKWCEGKMVTNGARLLGANGAKTDGAKLPGVHCIHLIPVYACCAKTNGAETKGKRCLDQWCKVARGARQMYKRLFACTKASGAKTNGARLPGAQGMHLNTSSRAKACGAKTHGARLPGVLGRRGAAHGGCGRGVRMGRGMHKSMRGGDAQEYEGCEDVQGDAQEYEGCEDGQGDAQEYEECEDVHKCEECRRKRRGVRTGDRE
eukprot:1161045-Pelagomonas_calceolata.AAC.2